jgi:hypothetical protein
LFKATKSDPKGFYQFQVPQNSERIVFAASVITWQWIESQNWCGRNIWSWGFYVCEQNCGTKRKGAVS